MMLFSSRFLILLPLVLAAAAAVLSALCLVAGKSDGYMEDYAIVRLNTSAIGQNLFSNDDNGDDDDDDDDSGGFLGAIEDGWDKVEGELNDAESAVADKLASALGIGEWYSLHVMNSCEGMYKPKATASSPGLNATSCTDPKSKNRLNLTAILDHELSVGPLEISISDIHWPSELQGGIDKMNDVLIIVFILYVLAVAFSGISAIGCLFALVFAGNLIVHLVNLTLAGLGTLCTTVPSIIMTVAMTKGVDEINDITEVLSVTAHAGTKFLALTWAASGAMIVAVSLWIFITRSQGIKRLRSGEGTSRPGYY